MQVTETCSLRTEKLSETFTLENTNRMENPNKLLSLGKSSSGLFCQNCLNLKKSSQLLFVETKCCFRYNQLGVFKSFVSFI